MNSHGIETSIVGCVEEIVRAQIPEPFFSSFYLSLFFFIMCSLFLGTRGFMQR